jgi:DHA3 family macrolide efflux protein-like MFS transporter
MNERSDNDQKLGSMTSFIIIFLGQAFSLFGSQLVQFALVWWLTKTSGSASVLAFASIMAILPQILVGPFAGALIDRLNRRKVLMFSDGCIALAIVVLALLYTQGAVQIWHIYTVMVIRSVGGAFQWPTMQASTSLMVPKEHLSRVSGLTQAIQGLSNIIAPPLGALLIEILPIQNILAIDVSTAILAIGPLFFIKIPQLLHTEKTVKPHSLMLTDLREGFRYLWNWKGVLMITVIAMVINLLANPALSLTPILVTNHFEGGVLEFAWLQSAAGLGMVLGGFMLGIWGGFKQRVKTALLSLILMGFSFTLIGLTPKTSFIVAVGAIFSFGFMNSIANGSLLAVLQASVQLDMQGRIFTLVMSSAMAMSPLGLAIAGPVSDIFGVQIWFVIAGVATTMMGVGAFFIPTIIQIEDETKENHQFSKNEDIT